MTAPFEQKLKRWRQRLTSRRVMRVFRFADGVLTPTVMSQEGRALNIDATVQSVALKFQQATASTAFKEMRRRTRLR